MTDTHTHIYMPDFADGGEEAVNAALESGVGMMVLPGVDVDAADRLKALHERFPDVTKMALGLHPTELSKEWREDFALIAEKIGEGFSAIGETGMDLYWDASEVERQKEAFDFHLGMGYDMGLPVIIHCREALEPVLEVIRHRKGRHSLLIFHSFTGTREDVKSIREVCDPWFGINGVVTFKNAALLREAIPDIGLGRILLETDSPYLSPVPYRGKRNESCRLPLVRDKVAETLGVTPEEVERVTDGSAGKIFSN